MEQVATSKPVRRIFPYQPSSELVERGMAILGGDVAKARVKQAVEDGEPKDVIKELRKQHDAIRKFFFNLYHQYGEMALFKAVVSCEEADPVDPRSWLVACVQHKVKKQGKGVAEVLEECGFAPRLVDSFIQDILKPAKVLGLFDLGDDGALAKALAGLYEQIKYARILAQPHDARKWIDSPLTLLSRYVGWLGERDWDASSKVLMLDSPAFGQFRREYQRLEGRDPITGQHRHE